MCMCVYVYTYMFHVLYIYVPQEENIHSKYEKTFTLTSNQDNEN